MNDTEKIAILLFALGQKTSDAVLNSFRSVDSASVTQHLNLLKSAPPSAQQIQIVLTEFDQYFRSSQSAQQSQTTDSLADDLANLNEKPADDLGQEPEASSNQEIDAAAKSEFIFSPVALSGNSMADLNEFHPKQIAQAISGERPKVMAMVIECLQQEKKIAVLNLIPQESQGQVLSLLISGHSIPPQVQERIVNSVIRTASKVSSTRPEADDSVETIAKMISKLPREKRNSILSLLRDKDKENSDKVRRAIFKFEDIVQYADKSIQRILSEIDKHNLVIALADSEAQVCERVFANLSKRAKESLKEEIELHGTPSHHEVDSSKHCIVDIIADLEINNQLDLQAG